MTNRLKKIIIIGAVVIVFFLMINYSSSDKNIEQDIETLQSSDILSSERKAVVTLNRIESIDVSTVVSLRNVFKSLKDFSIEVFPEPIGRDDPFASL